MNYRNVQSIAQMKLKSYPNDARNRFSNPIVELFQLSHQPKASQYQVAEHLQDFHRFD